MEKIKILEKVLVYDRILRFNIDLLTGIKSELKADIEETKILGEALLDKREQKLLSEFLLKVEEEFLLRLEEALDSIYDEYEVFNFDITFLSGIPDEVEREMERLELINTLNTKLRLLKELLNGACCLIEPNKKLEVILTPFKVYCELINHAIEFNIKFENI
ncbi:hypothetical protein BCF55_0222 [Hydrogenivirga caldilitoris]|uniref:Uncharacterized protein n=1 Tax=Hydrogenivirga caldilitoris TaxID=246264 RepID=A0A497XS48_9AQUI|nr:hypothetical protein [Hydrogenivirga caldilitoris]RLJ69962.1 hypothetical protein BCF55_0222 [Hydrogenivirga caldilitoris]